jgi:hypothetical protein
VSDFRIPIDVVKREFDLILEDFCDTYLPGGVRDGHEYMVGGVDGGAGRSMAVHIGGGAKRGTWCDFAGAPNHRGDAIDLVAHVLFGGDKGQAIKWMIGECGLADVGHEQMAVKRAQAKAKTAKLKDAATKEAAAARARAFHIWRGEAQADIAGTPVEAYLAGRGIRLDLLGSLGALRYHPQLFNSESQRPYPAMVAAIVNGEGKFIAVHRTWLDVRADGSVTKAQLEYPKKALGLYKGGYISLAKGASGVSLRHAPAGDRGVITEGIENGLTFAMADRDLRVVAGVSLDNMANVPIPAHFGCLTIGGDNDDGATERGKLHKACAAHIRRGVRDLRLALAPPHFKDINDLALGKRRAG